MKGKKTGGRTAGTPNKTTASIRELLADHWKRYQESGQFQRDLDALDPRDRAVIMEKYAAYIAPKMQATAVDISVRTAKDDPVIQRLRELCGETDEDN